MTHRPAAREHKLGGAASDARRVQILFYNHTGTYAGAEAVLETMLRHIDRSRFETIVVAPATGTLKSVCEPLCDEYAAVDPLQARFTANPLRLIRYVRSITRLAKSLRRFIISRRPDIVHANSVRAGIVCTLATLGTGQKVAWHIHDRTPRHVISTLIRLLALFAPHLRTIAITEDSRRSFRGQLLRLFPRRAPTTVILNAINVDRFNPDTRTREERRRALGYSSQNFVIGIVGQISRHKNQLGLVRAFAEVSEGDPNLRLLIVGAPLFNDSKIYLEFIVQEAERLGVRGSIQFVGQQSDVGPFMQAMDLFVLNSVAEPFGLVLVEAMANGAPVLATAAGGVPEIVREGFNGFLVAPQDDQALAATLRRVMTDRAALESARKNALSDVRQRFSIGRYMSELERFYLNFAAVE